MPDSAAPERIRLDVWLDVACVCRTRSAARQACLGGKVSVKAVKGGLDVPDDEVDDTAVIANAAVEVSIDGV